jgi:hypothetical protein
MSKNSIRRDKDDSRILDILYMSRSSHGLGKELSGISGHLKQAMYSDLTQASRFVWAQKTRAVE